MTTRTKKSSAPIGPKACVRRIVIGAAITLFVATHLRADEPSLIRIEDLYRFDSPQGLVVALDGKSGVYARRWNDRFERAVRHSLWRVEGEAENRKPLEEGEPDARQPILSPDGKWIVFHSTRALPDGKLPFTPVPPYSDPATDLWLMPAAGGKAIPLAGRRKAYGRVLSDPFYGHVSFSPDGKRIAFVADDGIDVRTQEEITNNVRILREDQGEGYEGYRPAQIWIATLADEPTDVAATKIVRVTNDEVWYGDPQWTPDGKSLVVHANRTRERESVRFSINQNIALWQIDLATGKLTQLTTGPGPEFSPRISPDGKRLVCLSSPRRGSHMDVFNLLVVDLAADGAHSRVVFDHHGLKDEKPPHLPPLFPLPRDGWLSDNKLHFNGADKTTSRPQVVDLEQGPGALADSKLEAHSAAQAKLAAARSKLTPPADTFLRERVVAKGEVVTWKSFDGLAIEGILTRPTTPDAKPPFKMVLYPHGGPHSRSTLGFDFTVQVLAAHGYAVFQPNFRGSAGYGQRFIDADRFDLGGGDMRDILTGIDHLTSVGVVDASRQFIYGISYGGYTTCWLIGQTGQFRAAVPQNAVTDLHAMWGLSDIQSWTEWEFGGPPWKSAQPMRDRSPLSFVSLVKTPTLILHAANDRRCPLPMGVTYYRALQKRNVPSQMVIYPDEGHGIKQLPHQADVLKRVLDWFKKYDVKE